MVKTPSVIEEQIFGSINDTKPMCPSHRDTHTPSCFISCPTVPEYLTNFPFSSNFKPSVKAFACQRPSNLGNRG